MGTCWMAVFSPKTFLKNTLNRRTTNGLDIFSGQLLMNTRIIMTARPRLARRNEKLKQIGTFAWVWGDLWSAPHLGILTFYLGFEERTKNILVLGLAQLHLV